MKETKKRAWPLTTMDVIIAFESAYKALVGDKKVDINNALYDDRVFIEKSINKVLFEIRLSADNLVRIVLDQEAFEAKIIVILSGKENQKAHCEVLELAKRIEWSFLDSNAVVYDED